MTSPGFVLAFFGDAEAAQSALHDLRRAGYRRIAAIAHKSDGKITVSGASSFAPHAAIAGAALGLAAGRFFSPRLPRADTRVFLALGAAVGGVVAGGVASIVDSEVAARVISR